MFQWDAAEYLILGINSKFESAGTYGICALSLGKPSLLSDGNDSICSKIFYDCFLQLVTQTGLDL